MTNDATGRPSTPALVADALHQMATLFEAEIRLVRTELSEKITSAVRAVVVLLVSAVLLLVALFLLLVGFVELLVVFGLQPWQAYMAVGGGLGLIGLVALFFALRGLSAENLTPKRVMTQFAKDAEVVKEQVK